MYVDPTKLRSHVVKIRFSDEEAALVEALTNYTGEQKAVLLRELVLEQATSVLFGESGAHGQGVEVTTPVLRRA